MAAKDDQGAHAREGLRQERNATDGHPYYCRLCGADFAEYQTCDDGECELESVETASARRHGGSAA